MDYMSLRVRIIRKGTKDIISNFIITGISIVYFDKNTLVKVKILIELLTIVKTFKKP